MRKYVHDHKTTLTHGQEVSTLLGIRLESVYRAANNGILPHLRTPRRRAQKGHYRFHPDAIAKAFTVVVEQPSDELPNDWDEDLPVFGEV